MHSGRAKANGPARNVDKQRRRKADRGREKKAARRVAHGAGRHVGQRCGAGGGERRRHERRVGRKDGEAEVRARARRNAHAGQREDGSGRAVDDKLERRAAAARGREACQGVGVVDISRIGVVRAPGNSRREVRGRHRKDGLRGNAAGRASVERQGRCDDKRRGGGCGRGPALRAIHKQVRALSEGAVVVRDGHGAREAAGRRVGVGPVARGEARRQQRHRLPRAREKRRGA